MYSNNILNVQESTTILNVCTKKYVKLLNAPRIYHYAIGTPWSKYTSMFKIFTCLVIPNNVKLVKKYKPEF